MTRAKISEYSATAGDNTDVNGVNIAEGCPPSSMNNMGREIMAALKRFQVGSDGDGVTVGGSLVVSGATTLTTVSATVVQSDTVNEKTSAAGVTIDGVLLKDNGVVTGAGTVSAPVYSTTGDTNTGIFFPAADTIAFAEGGAEAMRIDSSGNVGIGTTSPISKLEVYAGTGVGASHATIGAVATGYWNFNSGGNPTTRVILRGYDSSAVEAIRLDPTSSSFINGGNLLVGTTSALAGFSGAKAAFVGQSGFIAQTNSGDSTFECGAFWHPATSGNNTFAIFGTEATYTGRGSITYNRAGGLVAYNTTSDYRAKDISGPITDSGALIDSVPVYMGKMKGATQERPMFIAHETPSYAHTGEKDAVDADGKPVYQQMDASALIPVMWAELQLLRTRMAASEDIITFLTARVEALEGAQA